MTFWEVSFNTAPPAGAAGIRSTAGKTFGRIRVKKKKQQETVYGQLAVACKGQGLDGQRRASQARQTRKRSISSLMDDTAFARNRKCTREVLPAQVDSPSQNRSPVESQSQLTCLGERRSPNGWRVNLHMHVTRSQTAAAHVGGCTR